MKWRTFLFTGFISCSTLVGQDQKAAPQAAQQPVQRAQATELKADPGWQERDKKLRQILEGAVLEGRWRLVEKGELKEEQRESYRIVGLAGGADNWLIRAQMQLGGETVTLPVPVIVTWQGESPIITLRTNTPVRQLSGYSARVIFTDTTYAGTWSSQDKTGLIQGSIRKP